MSMFKQVFTAVNAIFVRPQYDYNKKVPKFIADSVYNCRGLDVVDAEMISSELNGSMKLYFIFVKQKLDDLIKIELFIDNEKRNIAFIIPDSIYTDEMLAYGKMLYIEKIYQYLFTILKLPFKEACSKPYKDSELHYMLDIAPDIMTLFTIIGHVPNESLKFIPGWLKHEAPRYEYDDRLINELLKYESVTDLFDNYTIISVIKDIYEPLEKSKRKKDDDECLIVQ